MVISGNLRGFYTIYSVLTGVVAGSVILVYIELRTEVGYNMLYELSLLWK